MYRGRHPSARGRIIIYSCGLTREQSSVFTRTFSRSQSLEIVSLLSAARSLRRAHIYVCIYVCIYLGAASFPRRFRRKIRRSVHPDIWRGSPLGDSRRQSLHGGPPEHTGVCTKSNRTLEQRPKNWAHCWRATLSLSLSRETANDIVATSRVGK